MTLRAVMPAIVAVLLSVLCLMAGAQEPPALPDGADVREALRAEVREMPSLIRLYTFADLESEGLTFVPGKADGTPAMTGGPGPEQGAVSLDRGWLAGEPVDIPEDGITVACRFRHRGMGGLTHFEGRRAYHNGGIAASGHGWRDGWRIIVTPGRGSVGFSIGRPEEGAISAVCPSGVREGQWHHLAATWDGRHICVYLDGVLRGEQLWEGPYTPGGPGSSLRIGEVGAGVGTIKLDVAELAIFDEALAADTIARFADPLQGQTEAIIACLMEGDRLGNGGAGTVAERESAAREQYRRVLELDPADNPFVIGNYHAIARLRIVESLRREGLMEQAREECAILANDTDAPLHYRARALLLIGDLHRDERQYDSARKAWATALDFFTGRHENFRVEALQRLEDVDGLADGEAFVDARRRRIERISHPARIFHVAPDGDDTAPGTEERPFATLERARDAIRELKREGELPAGGVAVYLRAGTHQRETALSLAEEYSGTLEAPVVYRSYPGESATISGGREISGFTPLTGETTPERLPAEAREHVVALDLRAQGIEDFGAIQPRGFALEPVPAHLELLFNGTPMQLARWPNPVGRIARDFATVQELPGEEIGDFLGKPMEMTMSFVYGDERHAKWAEEPDAWIYGYWARWYAGRYLPVEAIEPERKIIRLGPPQSYHRPSGEYTMGGLLSGAPYFGINLLCELDSPGEWYLDRDSGILYFWPPSPVGEGRCVVSLLEEPLVRFDGVSHVVLRDLTLEAGRADAVRIIGGEGVMLAGCTIRNMGNSAVVLGDAGSRSTEAEDMAVGGRDHVIVGCDIHGMGDGGVSLIGGDVANLTPSGHVVENCHIHHFNRWNRAGYQPALRMDGVGCRASHNLIHDGLHQAVHVKRNDHIFEYNEVHDVPVEAREMGLYYMYGRYRVLGERGNIARYNYFHHVPYTTALAKDFVSGGRAIFHIDHMNGGMTIYGNIFHEHEGVSASFFSGGRHNMVENNVFYQCDNAITISDRSFVWDKVSDAGRERFLDYLRDLDVDNPPWSTRYPDLVGLTERERPAAPENNLVARNIGLKVPTFIRISDPPAKTATIEHNAHERDPGFAAPDGGDFTIRQDSTIFGEIGFDSIPLEQIGLYEDELRATWPVKHEVDTHEHMSVQRTPREEMPTCRALPRTAEITVDGTLAPEEWDGADREDAVIIDRSPARGPSDAPPSHAWIRRDDRALYVGVLNEVNPDQPLSDGKSFWQRDMVEVIVEGRPGVDWWVDDRGHGPVMYLVGDYRGRHDSVQIAGLPVEPADTLRRTT
ncbi:MAG: hypothetical protein GF393_01260, partial [Armatimonadia bacterium]|nr:hypothetical protein [Armatimonadia bacterium]